MDIGLSLDPRLEVFRQKMFIVFPLLEEKKPQNIRHAYTFTSAQVVL